MIDFNKTVVIARKPISTISAIKKRRPKNRLTSENIYFLRSIGLLK